MADNPVDLKQLEQSILNYLEKRPEGWKWFMGPKSFGRDETIEKFRKDQKFRALILSSAIIKSINDFKA